MSMSEKIKPALTAEDWEVARDDAVRGMLLPPDAPSAGYDVTDVLEPGSGKRIRHAIAALALYNQPFGFTREDVIGLRERAANSRESERHAQDNMNVRIMNDARRAAELFESLADRIEALLPPEVKHGICPERMRGEVEHLFVFGKPTCECGERRSPHMR